MITAIYPGSFDPVTYGHLDVIERSSSLVGKLIIGVLHNDAKSPLFSTSERVSMLEDVTSHIPNVEVKEFCGLSVDFARANGASAIVRGLRAITDFEYELQMAQTNRIMKPEVDTMFLTTSLEYAYLSSTMVKEVAHFGGDISKFVPEQIKEKVLWKVNSKESTAIEK